MPVNIGARVDPAFAEGKMGNWEKLKIEFRK